MENVEPRLLILVEMQNQLASEGNIFLYKVFLWHQEEKSYLNTELEDI